MQFGPLKKTSANRIRTLALEFAICRRLGSVFTFTSAA
jgi:hypothetical protein